MLNDTRKNKMPGLSQLSIKTRIETEYLMGILKNSYKFESAIH